MISRLDGRGETETQHDIIKSGLFLNMFHFLMFVFIGNILANAYFSLSTGNAVVKTQGIIYSRIIFCGSFGLFIKSSLFIIVLRQIVLLVPLAWAFHFIGLNAVWWTFPVTEIIASMTGILIIVILHKKDSAL